MKGSSNRLVTGIDLTIGCGLCLRQVDACERRLEDCPLVALYARVLHVAHSLPLPFTLGPGRDLKECAGVSDIDACQGLDPGRMLRRNMPGNHGANTGPHEMERTSLTGKLVSDGQRIRHELTDHVILNRHRTCVGGSTPKVHCHCSIAEAGQHGYLVMPFPTGPRQTM